MINFENDFELYETTYKMLFGRRFTLGEIYIYSLSLITDIMVIRSRIISEADPSSQLVHHYTCLVKQKWQTLSGSGFSNASVCCFSLFYIILVLYFWVWACWLDKTRHKKISIEVDIQ